MILTGEEIHKNISMQKIQIEPFDPCFLTTNSYDLHLGNELITYTNEILDPRVPPNYIKTLIPEEGVLLQKGSFCLASTVEIIGSDHFVPMLHNRSSTARKGLFIHITADLVDIGYKGNLTLQLYATLPIRIYSGMRIAQVTFWVPSGEIVHYNGKYMNSKGPRVSELYKDIVGDESQ